MKRTKLADRTLPSYTRGEERMNMISHIAGCAFAQLAFLLCVHKAVQNRTLLDIVGAIIYGTSMITVYSISSIYHGLRPGLGKKVLQVIDHCAIYLLIAGTYTPILLTAFLPKYPEIAWFLLALQWGLGSLAITLTAIDLKKYKIFSMICYIFMGWSVIFFIPQTLDVLGGSGFRFILWGGIAYTVGAIMFGIGSKIHWIHGVFHLFVILGSVLQFFGIYLYVL